MSCEKMEMNDVLFERVFPGLQSQLASCGFEVLGLITSTESPHWPSEVALNAVGIVIISPGQKMWRCFSASSQYDDGQVDPLDRWTEEVLTGIASDHDARLSLPFDQPYPPLQQWAMQAGGLEASPLGILMHPEYGTWFGIRGVLFVEVNVEIQLLEKLIQAGKTTSRPCQTCREKPCLNACPVKAFSAEGLDVNACFSHLAEVQKNGISPDCHTEGCVARDACPVGTRHKYSETQLQFHMRSYYSTPK